MLTTVKLLNPSISAENKCGWIVGWVDVLGRGCHLFLLVVEGENLQKQIPTSSFFRSFQASQEYDMVSCFF